MPTKAEWKARALAAERNPRPAVLIEFDDGPLHPGRVITLECGQWYSLQVPAVYQESPGGGITTAVMHLRILS